jgi:hypothetical protein
MLSFTDTIDREERNNFFSFNLFLRSSAYSSSSLSAERAESAFVTLFPNWRWVLSINPVLQAVSYIL